MVCRRLFIKLTVEANVLSIKDGEIIMGRIKTWLIRIFLFILVLIALIIAVVALVLKQFGRLPGLKVLAVTGKSMDEFVGRIVFVVSQIGQMLR